MAVSFHPATTSPALACDDCGSLVDSSERGRAAHQRWHDQRDAIVVDLRDVVAKVA